MFNIHVPLQFQAARPVSFAEIAKVNAHKLGINVEEKQSNTSGPPSKAMTTEEIQAKKEKREYRRKKARVWLRRLMAVLVILVAVPLLTLIYDLVADLILSTKRVDHAFNA